MRAHAPASVTGLYAPAPADEEEGVSRGASVALEAGVTVEVQPAESTAVTVDGETVGFEPVERVLAELGVEARVAVDPAVPLGSGFGASGAATLATALAANARFDLGRARDALLAAAHRAELAAGTGQGDVCVQDRGGFVWSAGEGIRRLEPDVAVEFASAGSVPTEAMLADEAFMATARRVGPPLFERLGERPTVREFVERSREYVAETGLATPFVTDRIDRVEDAGGAASMALFGETVFAVDVDGVLDHETRVSNRGARLLDG